MEVDLDRTYHQEECYEVDKAVCGLVPNRAHEKERRRPRADWDKEMKKSCGGRHFAKIRDPSLTTIGSASKRAPLPRSFTPTKRPIAESGQVPRCHQLQEQPEYLGDKRGCEPPRENQISYLAALESSLKSRLLLEILPLVKSGRGAIISGDLRFL
ncbi:unnamed protein product [Nezara viridula]|uniref:Uncharacterized protein n=1 Tax=Nezara viridula TaxID=85310 RepID=A0A9P0HST8_NEZVI|nr:unnamed protein product [Nezara viridula]